MKVLLKRAGIALCCLLTWAASVKPANADSILYEIVGVAPNESLQRDGVAVGPVGLAAELTLTYSENSAGSQRTVSDTGPSATPGECTRNDTAPEYKAY